MQMALPDGGGMRTLVHFTLDVTLGNDGRVAVIAARQEVMPMSAEPARTVVGRIAPAVTLEVAVEHWERDLALQERTPLHTSRAVAAVKQLAATNRWTTPADMKPEHLREWLGDMIARKLAARTRNTARGYLHRFAEFCVAQGWIGSNPFRGVGRARVIRKQARYVPTEDQVRALIEAAKKDRRTKDRWLVYLTAATTGLRWETLRKLDWAYVKLAAHPPRLQLPGHLLKAREPATVFLTAEVADELRRLHAGRHQPKAGRVFLGVPKWDGFQRDRARAGIPRGNEHDKDAPTFSPHSLRHFASNRMLWAGRFSDAERARQNQHQSVAMTTDVYTDAAHPQLGEKIFAMQPLMPQRVSVGKKGKTSAHPILPLTETGVAADDLCVQPQSSSSHNALTASAASASSLRLDTQERFELSGPSVRDSELSVEGVSAVRGVSGSEIGVSGFEPPASPDLSQILETALKLAQMALALVRDAQAIQRLSHQTAAHAKENHRADRCHQPPPHRPPGP